MSASNSSLKLKVQSFGRFLSNMVMPNIGAFIAWGLITALFIPTGWCPNETIAQLVGPMIKYMLPLLIGYSGGKLVYGERGAVVGAITTMGVIVGADMPMFLGAMIVGPLGGYCIKLFDNATENKIPSGFEMLVSNFSAGIIGMLLALLAFFAIGPFVKSASQALSIGVGFMVDHGLLPLTSILVEPAKILFLNNAINHGVFTPIGAQQVTEFGKSIFFLIEANPGPGFGLLLAYMFFGKGSAKSSASGAAIIHFLGGIHEIYFPYVLMNPKLIIAVILSGMSGVFTLTLFNAGLTGPASPGSVIAVLLVAKGSYLGVVLSITVATIVSFILSSIILKSSKVADSDLAEAQASIKQMKAESKGSITTFANNIKEIIVACDAGMGSSAMGATILKKKLAKAGLDINVKNVAINSLTDINGIVITHTDLTLRAKKYAPNAQHISLTNFLDNTIYDELVSKLAINNPNRTNTSVATTKQEPKFSLTKKNIFLGLTAQTKEEAISYVGEKLVELGYVEPPYIKAMLVREQQTSTYLDNGIAIPHGTNDAKDNVLTTGIVFCQYPAGVAFDDNTANILIGIAAKNNEHMQVLTSLTDILENTDILTKLKATNDANEVIKYFK